MSVLEAMQSYTSKIIVEKKEWSTQKKVKIKKEALVLLNENMS